MPLFVVIASVLLLIGLGPVESKAPLFEKVDFPPSNRDDRIDLTSNWTIYDSNRTFLVQNLTLPFSVHSALLRDNLIQNPYYRFNDVDQRWVTRDLAWTFANTFFIKDASVLNTSRIDFVLDAANSMASVYLNNKFVVFVRNEFLKYEIDNINDKLQPGVNVLEVKFSSPVQDASELAELYPYRQPLECPPAVQHGECHVNFLRKQQCSFSWDWGPAMVPVGINGEVFLRVVPNFDFEWSLGIYPSSLDTTTSWILDITLDFILNNTGPSVLTEAVVNVNIEKLNYTYSQITLINTSNQDRMVLTLTRDKYNIEMWWPQGYGNQTLYDISVEIVINNQSLTKTKRSGFRSVELVQRPIAPDIDGLSFYFRINNEPVFMKGSNWIPAHSFQEYITPDYLRWLLESAVASNVIVLRVWGGGLYESEMFYEMADELGIMIWQDFMFACSVYPTNADFLANVQAEVAYQVNRLRHRPSIVIWSGNNENEAALADNWYGTNIDKKTYANDYRTLYVNTIRKIVTTIDSELSRPFLSSSPTNGLQSIKENWIARNPSDVRYGDVHFYDYKMNGWLPSSFPLPRFMSEYGVQSFPSISTLSTAYNFTIDGDYYSDLTNHRQHHDPGNQQILDEIQNNLALPNLPDKLENFKSLIYLSQLNQAMTYKTASELFRRNKEHIDNKTGIGMTMGSMYWQFNDIWQAPTWSAIEFGGKWKMAQYHVRKAYSPVLVSPVINGKFIDIYGVSDYPNKLANFELNVKIFSFDSMTPKYVKKYPDVYFYPLSAVKIDSLSLDVIQKEAGCELNNKGPSCILVTDSDDEGMPEGGFNFLLFNNKLTSVTNLAKNPGLKVTQVTQTDKQVFKIDLQADQIAAFVWLDMNTNKFLGRFSDNGFQMTTETRTVYFQTQYPNVDVQDIQDNLLVKSFVDYY